MKKQLSKKKDKKEGKKERYERLSAACEPFVRAKTETIHTLAGIGRKHRLLRYPVMLALVLFIFIYNVILYGCIQLKVREKFAKSMALAMTVVLVLVSVDVTAFAMGEQSGDGAQSIGVITAFSGPDKSVAEQSLPVGAKESEINFPDTLTVTLETTGEAGQTAGVEAEEETRTAETEAEEETKTEEGATPGESIVSENTVSAVLDFLLPEPAVVYAAELVETEVSVNVTWRLDTTASTPETFDSSEAGGVYIYVPVVPKEYAVAEGVSLPQIKVTVREDEAATAAGKLLEELLYNYFDGLEDGAVYEAILGMDEETRLRLTGDYEQVLAVLTQEDDGNERLQYLMESILRGITDAAENMPIMEPVLYQMNAETSEGLGEIPLRKTSGSGNAFVYHSFQETKTFTAGETYAFLNGVYEYDDAVSSLGSGAILKAADTENKSTFYIKRMYGESAGVEVFVDVVTRGRDFDNCIAGGLYVVPGRTPTEYRYFCRAGGAQNCGPYYAYDYVKESLGYDDVSDSLNDIEKQGSEVPEDYTVRITYNGGQSKTLDTGSYTVQVPDPASDKVIIVVSDNEGNSITTEFQCPLVVRYDGNAEGVSNVASLQPAWKGESCTISMQKPVRDGYEFINWKDADTENFYSAGQSFSAAKSLNLLAQWKDVKAPEVGYTPIQVMTRTSDEDVKNAIKAALTITDNELVEECTVEIELSENFASTVGNKTVSVKVADKAGNTTTRECVVNVTSFVDISMPVFTEETKTLSAVLNNPGTDTITESGFVWGVMNAPGLTVNNGRAKMQTAVSRVDDEISVTADNLQKGVTYYARAYIVADGVTYYSEELSFGLGLPAYGTFTVANNGDNTFTVTRSGGTEGTQTVYYRTVNGSAVGGTHFTHQAGTLVFQEGETTKTVTVTETGANTAYSGKPATAYTNADRIYSLELYRVTGGGSLGDPASAVRTMTKDGGYTVDRSIYTTEVSGSPLTGKMWVTDHSGSGDGNIYWRSDRSQNTNANKDNFNCNTNIEKRYALSDYIINTADFYLYRYTMRAHEDEDGWEHAWMGTHAPDNAGTETKCSGSYAGNPISLTDSQAGNAVWTAIFQVAQGKTVTKNFPTVQTNGNEDEGDLGNTVKAYNNDGSVIMADGTCYAKIPASDTVYNYYSASGANQDRWWVESFTDYTKIYDTVEPQLVAVAPMAGGLYKAGDSFTVSLVFDEIVDSANSGDLSNVTLHTSWGSAAYAGGADTNVLYFTGKVVSNASEQLSVNGFTNMDLIRDMCDSVTTTATASGGGSTTATVDISVPNFTVTAAGITNGTGTATVKVNADQSKTTEMRYVWSDSAAAPVSGWVELTAEELAAAKGSGGLSLSIRKEPGSGSSDGKWYLHVIASYSTNGATAYKNACVDFGTKSSPAADSTLPTLTVTADNTDWATERVISVQAAGAEELKYRASGESEWKRLDANAASVTVTENGYYTFLLTAGEDTVTKIVRVERIDKDNPTAFIGNPADGSEETLKEGVYTKLTLQIACADAQSGVKTVQYAWTDSKAEPSSWTALSTGINTVTYTAVTENTPTEKYLHLKVMDGVGHTNTTCSDAYTVISRTAVDTNTPTITITGAPESWTNDMVTLTWELANANGKDYEVILPDGRKAKTGAVSGQFWTMRNDTYTVTVRDLEYGGENTASVVVDKLDYTPPSVTADGISPDWKNSVQTLTLSAEDTGSGVGEIWYKIVAGDEEIPEDGLTQLGAGGSVTVDWEGEWYIYYQVYDKTGDAAADREANKTEGFAGPVRVDTVAPVIGTLTYNYEPKNLWDWLIGKESLIITVSVTEEGSGADEIMYTLTPEGGLPESKTAQIENGFAQITVSADYKGTIGITCTDQAKNTSPGVTVGTSGKGVIIEDNAPEVSFGKYTEDSGITVTVTDDQENAVSAGLAFVTYRIGDGEEVSLQENFAESLKTGTGFTITPEQIPTGVTDIIVKAVDHAGNLTEQTITIQKHQVTYDFAANGGDSATKASDVVLSGDEIDLTPVAVKSGWQFVGWNTDRNAETGLDSLEMENADITLYAIYSRALTLTCYSGGAGNKQTDTVTIYNDAAEGSLTVPAAKPWSETGEDYEFYGYVTDPDAFAGTVYGANSTISLSEDTALYAVYRKEIRIFYDANGGSGADEQIVYRRAHVADQVIYRTDSFSLRDGTGFDCPGYRFNGWTEGSGSGTVIKPGTLVTPTKDMTYYADWTEADYTVTLHSNGGGGGTSLTSYTYRTGAALPTDWARTGYVFGGWYDNADCNGTAVTEISIAETGNKEYWAKWIDGTAPVIGTLTYNYEPKNLWQWLMGKETLVITVPVAEEGSGADEITYTVTQEGGFAESKTAPVRDGFAQITVPADFKGTIYITCTDKAGNISLGVTVGAAGKGLLIEDNAPEIAFLTNGVFVTPGEYAASPEITVTVTDDVNSAVSAGLACVTYRIGDGEEVSVQGEFAESMKTGISFTIKADQIPPGGADIIVKAADNAGNVAVKKITIRIYNGTSEENKAADCTENETSKAAAGTQGGETKAATRTEDRDSKGAAGAGNGEAAASEEDVTAMPQQTDLPEDKAGEITDEITDGVEGVGDAGSDLKPGDGAIVNEQEERMEKDRQCGLCHICPTFLGICYFIWLAIILAIIVMIWIVVRRKRKTTEEKKE